MNRILLMFVCLCFSTISMGQVFEKRTISNPDIQVGAERMGKYLPLLKDKKIGIICNHTSLVGETHLVDTLLSLGVDVERIFAPEHGFRGDASAGATINDSTDPKTGLPIVSLYGSNKKPKAEMVYDLDFLIFDIQDVGARFYTYISTMHYAMEAAAENDVTFIVLDRPNPNGFYVDGPILDPEFKSFVGMHPIPVVHGLTVGELAVMINGEGWLKDGAEAKLRVVTCRNYKHLDLYELPAAPSPNLPTMESIYLYPSLCLFEGTKVSVGRGTETPFEIIGYPGYGFGSFAFKPQSIPGVSDHPKHEGEQCFGHSLTDVGEFYFTTGRMLNLDWIIGMYETYPDKDNFFTGKNFIDKLAGTSELRKQIIAQNSIEEIRRSWEPELSEYKMMRKRYLLYTDFE